MENKIKFSDVPIGAKFEDRNIYIKTDSVRFINLNYPTNVFQASLFWDDGVNHEVELVSKCSNCVNYCKHNHCFELNIRIGYDDGLNDYIDKNPETFSCSLFEIKNLAEGE